MEAIVWEIIESIVYSLIPIYPIKFNVAFSKIFYNYD